MEGYKAKDLFHETIYNRYSYNNILNDTFNTDEHNQGIFFPKLGHSSSCASCAPGLETKICTSLL